MTFQLERFRTDRTWYGSARMTQGGRWYQLIRYALPALLSFWASLGLGVAAAVTEDPVWLAGLPFSLIALGPAWVYYRVAAFRYLTSHKQIGPDVALTASPRWRRVLGIYVLGSLAVSAILGLVSSMLVLVLVGVLLAAGFTDDVTQAPAWVAVPLGLIGYFAVFVLWDVLTQVFIRLPLLEHYASTLRIEDPVALTVLVQRDRDSFLDAGGFAEALDVGAAI